MKSDPPAAAALRPSAAAPFYRGSLLWFLLLSVLASAELSTTALSAEQKETVKLGLLAHLGLSGQPVWAVDSPSAVPEYMWRLYDKASRNMLDADAIRHFYPQELLELNSGLLLSFNLSASVRMESVPPVVRRASLRLRLRGSGRVRVHDVDRHNSQIQRLLDSQLFNDSSPSFSPSEPPSFSPSSPTTSSSSSSTPSSYSSLSHSVTETDSSQWVDMDVTAAVMRAYGHADTMSLSVVLPSSASLSASALHSLSSARTSRLESVALVLFLQNGSDERIRKRTRRDVAQAEPPGEKPRRGKGRKKNRKGHHSKHPHRRLCQRVDLHVDFKELNWDDWILSPMGYNAFMCSGECPNPLPAHLNASNHAIVQSLLNSLNPSVPAPCCVPTEMSPLHILYRDINNQIVMKSYPDMRVEACGCR